MEEGRDVGDGRGKRCRRWKREEKGAFYRRVEGDDDSLSRQSRGKNGLRGIRGISLKKRGIKVVMRFR